MSSLLRSTKFVRYFTGAARTLIINSAKTAEGNFLNNYKALSAANSVLLRDYATKKNESLEPLLQKLDSEVRKFGRITKRDIDEVFDELRAKNDITSSQSLLVIRCCGDLVPEELPEQRTLLVQKIWNVLTERGVPMDVSHYNALLRVYIENEHAFSPAKFLEEMEKKGLQPNRVTYQRLMWHYCQEGDVDGATKVLEKMRELNMPVSEPVLNALIMGHAFHGDVEGAKAVLETMASAGLKPSNRSYALLACGYAKQGDLAGVEGIINSAKEQDNYLTDKDLLDIIEQLALGGHGDKVEQIFPHFHKGAGFNQEVCNLVLKLLNKRKEDVAKKMLTTMLKVSNMQDTMFKGAFYIKHLLKVNKSADEIIESCRQLQTEGLIENAIYIATEASLVQGKSELAQKLFQELKKDGIEIRQHYYYPILAQKGKERDEEGLLQVVKNMSNEGLSPTGEALRDFILPYLIEKDNPQNVIVKLQLANVPIIHSARNIMLELLDDGDIKKAAEVAKNYRPRGQFATLTGPLINALTKTKDVDSFAKILHVASSAQPVQEDNDDIQTDKTDNISSEVGRIVKIAVKNICRENLTENLLTAILSKGIKISTSAAEEIEQYLGNMMTTKISELLAKLTSAELEMAPLESVRRDIGPLSAAQLEQVLHRLESKDGNVNRLRKQVLMAYVKENNIDKVSSLIEEFKNTDFDFNLATLAQLFEFYCERDEIDKAKEINMQIIAKDPEFALTKYKKVLMASGLVKQDRYDEAVQYLKDNKPMTNGDKSTFLLNSKCWQILNALAEKKDVAKVKEMTNLLIESGYIEPSNVILGPSIKVHLLNDDLEGALQEFEQCSKQYRSTPWKGELMKALILKEDASKLQWLADLSTQIHGEVNILHDLVFAFVECGKLRQARRILETPGLQTRQKRVQDACQRYVDEGKSEYLEGLLEATKELSHIDRSNIFYHLLVTYCKADETDKALGLWTVLQEENEVPSEQFLTYLGNHLKTKNRSIPFILPQSEKETKHAEETKPTQAVQTKPTQAVQTKPRQTSQTKAKQIKESKPTKTEISNHIEKLVQEGKIVQASDYTLKVIEEGIMPKSNVIKYLFKKLAEEGNVEKIQTLGKHFDENFRRQVTYDDKLTLGIFARGAGLQHMDNILTVLENSDDAEEVESILKRFPKSHALAAAVQNTELIAKCEKGAELAAAKGHHIPANLLWMEYILAEKNKEADSIWQKCLLPSSVVVFKRLLQESHSKNKPEYIEKLIDMLHTHPLISKASLGNAYSRLINLYITNNNTKMAKAMLDRAFEKGIEIEHMNITSLRRLKEKLETEGKTFEYSI